MNSVVYWGKQMARQLEILVVDWTDLRLVVWKAVEKAA